MCELSVDEGEQRNEQSEVDRSQSDDWNDRAEKWVQSEVTNAHRAENRFRDDEMATKVGTKELGAESGSRTR